MAISTHVTGYAVTAEDWNEIVNTLNLSKTINLLDSFSPPTGTTSAAVEMVNSTVGTPAPCWTNLLFDSAAVEYMTFPFTMPANYVSAPKIEIGFYGTATAGTVVFGAAILGRGAETTNANFGTAYLGTFPVNGTAGVRTYGTITLTDTGGLSAGEKGCVNLYRAVADAQDSAGGDCKVDKVVLTYAS